MRILVMFDLPTGSKSEKKSYAAFRKFLLSDGYSMEQFSVYSRIALDLEHAKTHIDRLERHKPKAGRITVLTLTEKQYEHRKILICSPEYEQKNFDIAAQLTLVL